ncbi:tyrosine-protein phosphatase non-receptor type 4-like isoform X1 [Histomonas meleagridis]|uniref:tyrosine-protein phosphatase non-receptor type 4-like isoform X1 n=1 Tax=Histomonas meleagridis TaxID=135588 RepID=UPI003559B7E8|nr:tyrosine-protein phosphatase non-receptor type 4-like isoform X1 [Histomonas meleagridis]
MKTVLFVKQCLIFYVSSDLEKRVNLPKVWLETIRTGKEVADTLVPIMKLDPKIEYAILLWILKESYKWVLNDQTLASANPYRGTILFVIEAFPRIKIYFSMGKTKVMILPIVKKVEELIPIVAKGNGLAHYLGFTLYLPSKDGQPPKPLDTNISIPEQATRYSELEFRRRFFIITKSELEDPVSLYQAFCDVRELILSGRLALSQDNALELMYYALVADGPTVLTPTTIPNENSFPAYLPVNMKVNYKTGKNKINEFLNTIPVEGKINAMIKYIQKARSLPQFGCEEFQVILVEEKNGHTTRTNVILFCGPYKVFVMDENRKNVLVNVPYQKFIKLETFGIELSIKYCTEEFTAGYCNIESERAEEIASLILSYLNLQKKNINAKDSRYR